MLSPVSAYRSQTTFQNFPLVTGLPSETSAMAWETRHFVRLLLRYYADVRLLNSVHVRITATGLPLPSRRLFSAGTAELSRFSNIECPRMHRVSDSAGPDNDWLDNAVARNAFPVVVRGRRPGQVISEFNGWPALPLSTLHVRSHDRPRMTRGHDGSAHPFM